MSSLTDVVVQTLQSEPERLDGARGLLRRNVYSDDISPLQYIKKAENALQRGSGIWESACCLVVLIDQAVLPDLQEDTLAFLMDAYDCERNKKSATSRYRKSLQFLRKESEEMIYEDLLHTTLWGWPAYIEFIQGIWGKETARILSEATGASLANAKRWIKGGGARKSSYLQVLELAFLLYHLHYKLLWTEDRIRSWIHEDIDELGLSPIQYLSQRPYCRDFYQKIEKYIS